MNTDIRNEIKAQIVRSGFTMQELVDRLHDGVPAQSEIARGEEEQRNERALALARERAIWSLRRRSDSVSNLSAKLQRKSIRYREVVELADVLGYELVWQRKKDA